MAGIISRNTTTCDYQPTGCGRFSLGCSDPLRRWSFFGSTITTETFIVLETCRSTNSNSLLSRNVWKQPFGSTICYAITTQSFHSNHLFLRPSNRTSTTLRPSRLRGTIHNGGFFAIAPVCSPNNLEHESQRLQR